MFSVRTSPGSRWRWQPVSGSDVLPKPPIEAVREGAASDISTLIGTTLEEWKLFSLMLPKDALRTRAVRPLRNLCEKAGRSADDVVAAYEAAGVSDELDLRNALETDRNFRIPAIRLAEAQVANGAPTWMYRFDWKSPAFGGRIGACHALEIPFAFDNLDAPGRRHLHRRRGTADARNEDARGLGVVRENRRPEQQRAFGLACI